MIYLIITFAGLILLFAGLYAMSFGFSTPPNFLLFFAGLCSFVIGVVLIILFGSQIDMAALKSSKTKTRTTPSKDRSKMRKPPTTVKKIMEEKKPAPKPVKPVKKAPVVKKDAPKIKPVKTEEKPKKSPRKFLRMPGRDKKKTVPKAEENKAKGIEDKASPPKKEELKTPKRIPRRAPIAPVKDKSDKDPVKDKSEAESPDKVKKDTKTPEMKTIKPVKKMDKNDSHYVKNRLDKLKKDYIENVDDVEELIEERLDSFRGALNQIRSESKAPSIIWSFDAADVQDAMKETIISAEKKVIMMYPWIRNIDVGILKKFMDTKSRMIIQEASLDDDAAVELIKVLLDNDVQIKTMPHVHTVALVSDDNHGLIISTDPIYESFEVGVIYKDEKSISEIEKLFEEAWGLSKDIELEAS
ncbi:MAG: hypothetical protein KKF16_07125 [Euryarchaeota archaeon]|nr:hypothetical protein [Euryarchaeota archaeon]MBU4608046.1 hypothetical protein [Euryarchaeota archaeon]MBV1730543.1 hypothetical protein [Methanobacterium sp.]MBV1755346.1 hypothetical protein [Methanobacterium sp.]